MILFDLDSVPVPYLYQCYNHDERHNWHHPDDQYFDDQNPEKLFIS